MRLTLARLEMLLWTALLPRRLDIWAISGVGTTSWFLLPVSTCERAFGQPSFINEFCAGETRSRWDFLETHRSEDTPIFGGKVAESFCVQLHD